MILVSSQSGHIASGTFEYLQNLARGMADGGILASYTIREKYFHSEDIYTVYYFDGKQHEIYHQK